MLWQDFGIGQIFLPVPWNRDIGVNVETVRFGLKKFRLGARHLWPNAELTLTILKIWAKSRFRETGFLANFMPKRAFFFCPVLVKLFHFCQFQSVSVKLVGKNEKFHWIYSKVVCSRAKRKNWPKIFALDIIFYSIRNQLLVWFV